MIINPYTNRKMIADPTDFFGRTSLLAEIFNYISTSQSVSIIGERRLGKSSILNMICHPDMRAKFPQFSFNKTAFVFVDLLDRANIHPQHLFELIMDKLSATVPNDVRVELTGTDFYDRFRSIIEHLSGSGYRLVFCFDEFDTVTQNENFDLHFYSFLRSIANQYSLSIVTASQHRLGELCHSDEIKGSPFFNIFSVKRLGLMSESETDELIRIPSQRIGVKFGDRPATYVKSLAGGHPFFVQIACYHVFEKLKTGIEPNQRDYQQIERLIVDEASSHLQYAFDHLSRQGRDVLVALWRGDDYRDLDAIELENLETKGYLTYRKNQYHLFGSVLSRFIEQLSQTGEGKIALNDYNPEDETSPNETPPKDRITWNGGEVRGKILNTHLNCDGDMGKISTDEIVKVQIVHKGLGTNNLKLYKFRVHFADGSYYTMSILEPTIKVQTESGGKQKIPMVDITGIEFGVH